MFSDKEIILVLLLVKDFEVSYNYIMRKRNSRHRKKKQHFTSKVSDHFSKKDFYCKVNPSSSFKLSLGLVGGLELLRTNIKQRIEIIKGYESPESAEAKGKVSRNLHVSGIAADIQVKDFDSKELFKAAQDIPEFKGIGLNITENYVHVDTRKQEDVTLWVEENDRMISLTEENMSQYFGS